MRRFVASLLLALTVYLAAPPAARADVKALDAVAANSTSVIYQVGPATKVTVQAQSAAGSACVVTVKQKLPKATTWTIVATINNPSISGEIWGGAGGGLLQIEISSWTAGTVTVTLEAWAGMNQLI